MECKLIYLASLFLVIFASDMSNTVTMANRSTVRNVESTATDAIIPFLTKPEQVPKDSVTERDVSKRNERQEQQLRSLQERNDDVQDSSNCTSTDNATTRVSSLTEMNASGNTTKTCQLRNDTYKTFPEYKHFENLALVAPYITDIPGLISNVFIIITAINIDRVQTSEIFVLALGYADLVTVSTRFTLKMIERFSDTMSFAGCKAIMYFLAVAKVYSNLVLVSWSIERLIAVKFPIELASWRSIRNTKKIVGFLLFFCFCITVPYITESDATYDKSGLAGFCIVSKFMSSIWIHIESVYHIYIPMIVVCICSVTVICRRRRMPNARIIKASNNETIIKHWKESREKTFLFLSVSVIFLILHIPYVIVNVVGYVVPDETVLLLEDPQSYARYLLFTSIGLVVTDFQNSVNFVLFCIYGTKFRETFLKLFCKIIAANLASDTETNVTTV